jgi:hypothetical protein
MTFMVIYRSTMAHATKFMTVLEQINNVGMAVQIMDAMDDKSGQLKDATRLEIVRLLLGHQATVSGGEPDKGKAAHA